MRELATVMVEETEKSNTEILNDIQLQHSRNYMSFEELYVYEISKYSYVKNSNNDDLGLEAGLEG